ncbi:MAG: hypothetical protein ACO2OR_01565 [Desulfurococcaceae archaeon]
MRLTGISTAYFTLVAIHTYLPPPGLAISMIACYVITVALFARVLRKMYDRLFREITAIRGLSSRRAVMKIETITASALSILLLVSALHAVVVEAALPTPLYALLIEVVHIVILATLIYIVLRELGRVRTPPRIRKYIEQRTWI